MSRARSRRAIAGACAVAMLGITACSTDTVTPGQRPNRPANGALPTQSTETNPAKLTIDPKTLPGYTAPTRAEDGTLSRPLTEATGNVWWKVLDGQNTPLADPKAADTIAFGDPATYTDPSVKGVLTFRGNNYRTGGAYGTANVQNKKLEIVWSKEIGRSAARVLLARRRLDGPAPAGELAAGVKEAMSLDPNRERSDFVEVIYPVFEGKVYRLNLADGTPAGPDRRQVRLQGHRLDRAATAAVRRAGPQRPQRHRRLLAHRMFDLIQNKEVAFINGLDAGSLRPEWVRSTRPR